MVSQQKFIESTIWFVKMSKYWMKSVLNRNNIDYSWNSKIWHSYLVANLLDDGGYAISVALSHVAIIGWHLQFAISFLSNRSTQSNECVLISSREAFIDHHENNCFGYYSNMIMSSSSLEISSSIQIRERIQTNIYETNKQTESCFEANENERS